MSTSLENEPKDLSGLPESVVDSDADDDLADSIDVSGLIFYCVNSLNNFYCIRRVWPSEMEFEIAWKKIRRIELPRISRLYWSFPSNYQRSVI